MRRLSLFLALAFVSALTFARRPAAAQAAENRRLQEEALAALDANDFPRAIARLTELAARLPEDPLAAYNLACAHARAGDVENGVKWLDTAAARGFRFVATMLRDTDLDPLRGKPGYAEALEHIRQNNTRGLEEFKKKAAKAPMLTFRPSRVDSGMPTPLVVALHGLGGTAEGFAPAWRSAADRMGAVLVVPEAVDRWGNGFSWGIVEEAEYLVLRAVEKARGENIVDPRRIVLTGFSQGGGMAFTVAIRHPETFAGSIPVAGFYDHRVAPVPEKPPSRFPRFAILNGEKDREPENNRWAAKLLQAAKVPVLLKIYPGLGHDLPPNHSEELFSALRFVLGS